MANRLENANRAAKTRRQVLLAAGATGLVVAMGIPPANSSRPLEDASAETEFDQRLAEVRKTIAPPQSDAEQAGDDKDATQVSQWFNWPNWNNWPNYWRNF